MRCILCGREIKEKGKVYKFNQKEVSPYKDPFNDLYEDPLGNQEKQESKKLQGMDVCEMCKAKLKLEADESQKIPKPM